MRTLTISYGTSRGRETWGYTIARLRDEETGDLFRCLGGGYDMDGTNLAEWLMKNYGPELFAIRDRAYYGPADSAGRTTINKDGLYGLHFDGKAIRVDGACGTSTVDRIAEAIGVVIRSLPCNRAGNSRGWSVDDSALLKARDARATA